MYVCSMYDVCMYVSYNERARKKRREENKEERKRKIRSNSNMSHYLVEIVRKESYATFRVTIEHADVVVSNSSAC